MKKDLHKNIFNQLEDFEVPWSKSKLEVWQNLESRIDAESSPRRRLIPRTLSYAAAAILVLLLSSGLFIRFYVEKVETSLAEHITHQLPDGSTVEINAESSLSYNPYWWRFSRKLNFEGEGFFLVQKGKKFTVVSGMAETEVLGTSFTVYSRHDQYEVTCFTGKVKVLSFESSQSETLLPQQQLVLETGGQLNMNSGAELVDPMPWKSGRFLYTATPLNIVLEEIQRQYGIQINVEQELNYYYTGEVNVRKDIQTTLDLVCKPFRITFEQSTKGEYIIIGKER